MALRVPRPIGHTVMVGLLFFALAAAALVTTRFGNSVAFLWVANAVLMVELLFLPVRRWPLVLAACGLASMIATATLGFGPAAAAPLAVVNLSESVIGALLLLRLSREAHPLDTLGGVFIFIFSVGMVAPAITAPAGAAVAAWMGADFPTSAARWFTGHAISALAVAPIAILVKRGDIRRWLRSAAVTDAIEACVILLGVCATTFVVFSQERLPLLFLPILPLVIAIFRIGPVGGASSILIITALGGLLTARGDGAINLVDASTGDRLQLFGFYVAVLVLIALPIAADLTQRTLLMARLRESEARYRLLADNSSDIVMNLDPEGRILFVSRSITTLGDYAPGEVVGRRAEEFVHADDVAAVLDAHRTAFACPGEVRIVEYRGLAKDGALIWLEAHIQCVVDDSGAPTGLVSALRGVDYRKGRELKLLKEASTDPLTGLLNRRSFFRRVESVIEAAEGSARGCLALFDVDHFKLVNDQHGHVAGDRVLEAFAQIAGRVVREQDCVGRLGGEEFGLLLRGASPDQGAAVCERLRAGIAGHLVYAPSGFPIRVTVSAGMVSLAMADDREQLYRLADEALYEAKSRGRNRIGLAA